MSPPHELRTARLILRRWRAADRPAFTALSAAPRPMRYFPAVLTPQQSDELIDQIEQHFDEYGFGLWAVEIESTYVGSPGT